MDDLKTRLSTPTEDLWELFPALKPELPVEDCLPYNVKVVALPLAATCGQNIVSVTAVYLSLFAAGLRGTFRLATNFGPVGIGFNVMPVLPDASVSAGWLDVMTGNLKRRFDTDDEALRTEQSSSQFAIAHGITKLLATPVRNSIKPSLLASGLSRWGYTCRYFMRSDVSLVDEMKSLYPQELLDTLRMLHSSWSGEELHHDGMTHHIDLTGCFPCRISDAHGIYARLTNLEVPAPIICLRSSIEPSGALPVLDNLGFIFATSEHPSTYPRCFSLSEKGESSVEEIRHSIAARIDELGRPDLYRYLSCVPGLVRRICMLFTLASPQAEENMEECTFLPGAKAFVSHMIREHLQSLGEIAAAASAKPSDPSASPDEKFRAYQLLAKIAARQPITVSNLRKPLSKKQREALHSRLGWLLESKKIQMDENGRLTAVPTVGY